MAKYKAYPEYKDSGVEWLDSIPNNWTPTQVKYGFNVTLGKMLQKTKQSFSDELKPYLKAQNIQPDGINLDVVDKMWFSANEKQKLKLQIHDVLVSEGGDVGRTAIWKAELEECYVQNAINRVRPLLNNTSSFLYYWMNFLKSSEYISIICNKATIAHYTAEKLEKTFIFLPDEKQQVIISTFLNDETAKIDILIVKQNQLIELLKEKRQAVISHALTKGLNPDAPMKDSGVEWLGHVPTHWSISKARYCFLFNKGLTITKENLQDEGIPCINYGEIHSNYGFEINPNIHKLKCVNEAYLKSDTNALLIKGDIIFADTSEDVDGSGNFSQLTTDANIFAGYHTIIARPIDRQNYRFFAYLFDCQELRSQIKYAVKGVKVFSITQAILRGLAIWLPPRSEQEYISKLLDYQTAKIDTLIKKQSQQIELLKERRTALIAAAVTGKIDLRDWTPPASSTETSLTAEEAAA